MVYAGVPAARPAGVFASLFLPAVINCIIKAGVSLPRPRDSAIIMLNSSRRYRSLPRKRAVTGTVRPPDASVSRFATDSRAEA